MENKIYTVDFFYNETGHGEASGMRVLFKNEGGYGWHRRYFGNKEEAAKWGEEVVKFNYAIGRFEITEAVI